MEGGQLEVELPGALRTALATGLNSEQLRDPTWCSAAFKAQLTQFLELQVRQVAATATLGQGYSAPGTDHAL